MSFTLGDFGALLSTDKKKRGEVLQGGMSAIEDKNYIGNQLQQKSAERMFGNGIDVSKQSKLKRKEDDQDVGNLSAVVEKEDLEKGFDLNELLKHAGALSELTGNKNKGSGFSVSSQSLSGAGRLGTGLSLKDILKYRP